MLVGHLPFMEKMAGHLTAGNADNPVFRFQNGGIVCLDRDSDKGWTIRWALLPSLA
jgi:phosphohistidine phosphatase